MAAEIGLTRVSCFDIALEAPIIGFTPQQVALVPWAVLNWANEDGKVNVGQAVWVIEADGKTIVVDPCCAADAFLRTGPEATTHEAAVVQAVESAGFPIDSVSSVVMSHLDGIGMVASPKGMTGQWMTLSRTLLK